MVGVLGNMLYRIWYMLSVMHDATHVMYGVCLLCHTRYVLYVVWYVVLDVRCALCGVCVFDRMSNAVSAS